uniref:(northern house mosquito) hypothetical protein n=1 Tax=Culex pipiens TaxID=7175 RepID=A0A8D8IAW6_CULPI
MMMVLLPRDEIVKRQRLAGLFVPPKGGKEGAAVRRLAQPFVRRAHLADVRAGRRRLLPCAVHQHAHLVLDRAPVVAKLFAQLAEGRRFGGLFLRLRLVGLLFFVLLGGVSLVLLAAVWENGRRSRVFFGRGVSLDQLVDVHLFEVAPQVVHLGRAA